MEDGGQKESVGPLKLFLPGRENLNCHPEHCHVTVFPRQDESLQIILQ